MYPPCRHVHGHGCDLSVFPLSSVPTMYVSSTCSVSANSLPESSQLQRLCPSGRLSLLATHKATPSLLGYPFSGWASLANFLADTDLRSPLLCFSRDPPGTPSSPLLYSMSQYVFHFLFLNTLFRGYQARGHSSMEAFGGKNTLVDEVFCGRAVL